MKFKIIIGLWVSMILYSCKSQKKIVEFVQVDNSFIPGKCYWPKLGSDISFENSYILEVTYPIFDTLNWLVNETVLAESIISDTTFSIIEFEAYTYFEIMNYEDIVEYPKERKGKIICVKEQPPRYRLFSLKELQKLNFKINKVVVKEPKQLVRYFVKREPKILKENQLFFQNRNSLKFELIEN